MRNTINVIMLLPIIGLTLQMANAKTVQLNVEQTTLTINNKPIQVYNIIQDDGTVGYTGTKGDNLNAIINNHTNVPITLHWHGVIDRFPFDGVPYVTQLPLQPGKKQHINFPLKQTGTFWMHSQEALQQAQLMAAPLVIHPIQNPQPDVKNITVMIEDLTMALPTTVLHQLQHPDKKQKKAANMPGLYDIKSDVLLANRKLLSQPEVFDVRPGEKVRLRLINADSANNLFVHLPKPILGTLTAKDGEATRPYYNRTFQLGIANTLDIIITIPNEKNAIYPVFFQAEGRKLRAGILLKTGDTKAPVYSQFASSIDPGFTYIQTYNIHPEKPMPQRKIDRTLVYNLTGDMALYKLAINGQYWPQITPKFVKKGERVEIIIHNQSKMAHPMHIHGHIFQLIRINGNKVDGFKGSTVTVLPESTVTLIFDADNPGIWAFHCQLLDHLAAGMMTTINYISSTPPGFYLKKTGMTLGHYDKLRDVAPPNKSGSPFLKKAMGYR